MDDVNKYVREYQSHPGKTLSSHILGVYNRAIEIWDSPVVALASKSHDFGKLNPNFSIKLNGGNYRDLYTSHAYLSYLSLLSYYSATKQTGAITSIKHLIIASICVIKHHGGLRNLDHIVNTEERDRLFEFLKTAPEIPIYEFSRLVDFDTINVPFKVIRNMDKKAFSYLFIDYSLKEKILPTRSDRLNFFLEMRMCFSALVYGDKGDAGNQAMSEVRKRQIKFVNNYPKKINKFLGKLSKKPTNPLNTSRTHMREIAVSNLKRILTEDPDQRTFVMTYPTGAGKTIIMLTLAEVICSLRGPYRIIYSIPFLSITEQIFGIIEEEIFSKDNSSIKRIDSKSLPVEKYDFEEVDRSILFKMVGRFKKLFGGKDIKEEMVEKLLRQDYMESSFDYSLIVTTFVQLFQGFTTASNRGLMRFSHLSGSILLIDELQALPPSLYTFFVALIDAFCKKFNSYAIFSTATMPHLEIPVTDPKAIEMFKDYKKPPEIGDLKFYNDPIFNRYEIRVLHPLYNLFTICTEISKSQVPTLAVFNTVKDSREAYKIIKEIVDCPVYLMNSGFHAADRRSILKKVKNHILKNERVIMVSTQLIEAGVDIDFHVVYRDIAPLPNVIQTSGRCNREGKLDKGIVYLFRLYNEDFTKLRAEYIYNGDNDGPFLNYALNVFFRATSQTIFEEKDLLPLQMGFFKFISHNFKLGYWKENDNFIDQINSFRYGDIGEFTLIPKSRYGVQEQFYVPWGHDDDSYEILNRYIAELTINDTKEHEPGKDVIKESLALKKSMGEHVKKMRDRVVTANIPEDVDINQFIDSSYEHDLCHIYKLKFGFYDSEFGLKIT